MSSHLEVDLGRRLVRITVRGELTNDGLVELHEQLWNASGIQPDFSAWADLREADTRQVTREGLRRSASQPVPFAAPARCAILVSSDLAFGLARMYEMMRCGEGESVLVSRDVEAARQWLAGAEDGSEC